MNWRVRKHDRGNNSGTHTNGLETSLLRFHNISLLKQMWHEFNRFFWVFKLFNLFCNFCMKFLFLGHTRLYRIQRGLNFWSLFRSQSKLLLFSFLLLKCTDMRLKVDDSFCQILRKAFVHLNVVPLNRFPRLFGFLYFIRHQF